MSDLPIYFNKENIIASMGSPSVVHCHNTTLVNYFKRYLYQKAISTVKCNIPTYWNRDYLLYTLFARGYIAVVNTNKFGVICQECGLYGFDVFYAPTHATISNPLLYGILQPRINVQCVVIKLTPDYLGVDDIITYYANKLALAGETVDTNLVNTKLAYIFIAGNKAQGATFKTLYDDIASGKPAVVVDKNITKDDGTIAIEMFNQNLKQTYIASNVLEDMRKIENEFNTIFGIPNANIEKKERMIIDEVNANNTETMCRLDFWLESLKDGAKRANDMFSGLNLTFDKRYNNNEVNKENVKSESKD